MFELLASPTSLLDLVAAPLAAPAYGDYLAWWKALVFLLVFLVWIRLMLWIDKDTITARLPREAINAGVWGLMIVAFLAVLLIPTFLISIAAFVVLFGVSIGGYLIWRNAVVGLEDIPEQFSFWAKNLFKSGKQKRVEKHEEAVAEGMITLMDAKGNAPTIPAQEDPTRPAYETSHRMLLEPLYKGADRIVFANAGSRYATKFNVDGVDHPGMAVEPDVAAATLDYVKQLAGLDVGERRKHQTGRLKVRTSTASHDVEVQTSGTRSGETMLFEVDRSKRYRNRATALGMTPQQRELLAEVVEDNNGIVIAAAPPGGGLTALLYGLVQEHDAFVQHIITLERPIEREIEGVTQQALAPGADAAEEGKQLSWIADQLPDVLLVTHMDGREGANQVIRLVGEERHRAYVGMRARDVAEALARWNAIVGDARTALARLELVIVGRSMRKLCEVCKVPYTPTDQVLAKMGLPKGKIQELFRARTEPMLDQRGNPVPCEYCGQIGYNGRVGVFEMLRIDAAARQALGQDMSATNVRNLLRTQKQPTLNEAALRVVVAGKTDLQEVQRVMAPPAAAAPPAGGGAGPAGAPAKRPPSTPPAKPAAAGSGSARKG